MARQHNIDINREPILPDFLRAYSLIDGQMELRSEPATSFVFESVSVKAPMAERDFDWEYDVEVEYSASGGKALSLGSMRSYLHTFEEAKLTEEAMAETIRQDLKEVLEVDDLFVEVTRSDDGVKRTILGQPT